MTSAQQDYGYRVVNASISGDTTTATATLSPRFTAKSTLSSMVNGPSGLLTCLDRPVARNTQSSAMRSRSSKIVLFLLLTAAWQLVFADGVAKTLLVIGDSLSSGYGIDLEDSWISLLQSRLAQQDYGYRVVNASISGDTTTGGVTRLPRALELHQPDIVLIELGGNDGLRGTPISVMKNNLAAMIEAAQENGAQIVLAGMQIPPNYGADYAEEFAAVYPDLAAEYETALIDFFLAGVALDPDMMQTDNIHPNEKGQPLLLENAWAVLVADVLKPVSADFAGGSEKH